MRGGWGVYWQHKAAGPPFCGWEIRFQHLNTHKNLTSRIKSTPEVVSHSNTLDWRVTSRWRWRKTAAADWNRDAGMRRSTSAVPAPTGSLSQVMKAAEPRHPRRQGHRVLCKHDPQAPPLNLQPFWSHLYNFWFLNVHNNNLFNNCTAVMQFSKI